MKTVKISLAVLSLALAMPAQYGGGCAPAPAPAPPPAPSPAPSPAATPAPAPSPGATPAPAPGGATTPNAPSAGATTPGGRAGGATGAGGAGRGRTGLRTGKKTRFSSEQAFWLGSVNLPWEGVFLPVGGDGYGGRELPLDQAIKAKGGANAWRMGDLPSLVFVYDPTSEAHGKVLAKVCSDSKFKSVSRYFNLIRLDVRAIKTAELAKSFKDATFIVYRANGTNLGSVVAPTNFEGVRKVMSSALEADFGKDLDAAASAMGAVLARKAFVEDEIRRHAEVLVDPVTGQVQTFIKEKIAEYKAELKDLEHHAALLTQLSGGEVATR